MNHWRVSCQNEFPFLCKTQYLKMDHSRPLFVLIFGLFIQTIQFLKRINVKNVHPVFFTGIQTNNLLKVNLLSLPLDQGSHQSKIIPNNNRPWWRSAGSPSNLLIWVQIRPKSAVIFKIWANPGLFFVYFRPFQITNQLRIEKSVDGVVGIQTLGCSMVGADITTELWCYFAIIFAEYVWKEQ